MKTAPANIDDYIASFPEDVQVLLDNIRRAILSAAPDAGETIKYAMPTFVLSGNLVHFAAYERHIGFYPAPQAIKVFASELSGYKTSKGAIQFPINEPIPMELIIKITRFRVAQNLKKAE